MTYQEIIVPMHARGESMNWLRDHVSYIYDYCLIWPFSRKESGYPAAIGRADGNIYPLRYMCELVNGPPPTPEHEAAHSCGRGHEGCISPRHLHWKTPSENQLDRNIHGTVGPRRKLTPEQVLEIRSLKSLETTGDTARRFDLRESTIRLIQSGKMWKGDILQKYRTFSDAEIASIRSSKGTRGAARMLAAEYRVSEACIYRIQNGRTYKAVPRTAG